MEQQQQVTFDGAAVKEAGIAFAKSEVLGGAAVEAIARVLGTSPSFTLWGLVSAAFQSAYAAERKCSSEATAQAWSRLARRMKDAYGLAKPAAQTKASATRREEREGIAKQVDAALKKHKTVAALRREAGQCLEAGKAKDADVLLAAAKLAEKAEIKATKAAQAARWKAALEKVQAARKLADERTLSALEQLLRTMVPAKASK